MKSWGDGKNEGEAKNGGPRPALEDIFAIRSSVSCDKIVRRLSSPIDPALGAAAWPKGPVRMLHIDTTVPAISNRTETEF